MNVKNLENRIHKNKMCFSCRSFFTDYNIVNGNVSSIFIFQNIGIYCNNLFFEFRHQGENKLHDKVKN